MKSIAMFAVIVIVVTMLSAQSSDPQVRPEPGEAGPYVVVLEENRGPYRVAVWQSPERVSVGSVRFILELQDLELNPVDGAVITAYGFPPTGEDQKSPAINAPSTPRFYHAKLDVDEAGAWDFEFRIMAEDGQVSVYSSTDVSSRVRSGGYLQPAAILFYILSVAMLGAGGYVWFSARLRRNGQRA